MPIRPDEPKEMTVNEAKLFEGWGMHPSRPIKGVPYFWDKELEQLSSLNIDPDALEQAIETVIGNDDVLICAGAGMGIDSGMHDIRKPNSFWIENPSIAEDLNPDNQPDHKGYIESIAEVFNNTTNPKSFKNEFMSIGAAASWSHYGRRLYLTREARPHKGFFSLLRMLRQKGQNNYFRG